MLQPLRYRIIKRGYKMLPYRCQSKVFGVWVTVRVEYLEYKAIAWMDEKTNGVKVIRP